MIQGGRGGIRWGRRTDEEDEQEEVDDGEKAGDEKMVMMMGEMEVREKCKMKSVLVAKAKVKVAKVSVLKKPCCYHAFSKEEAPSVKGGKCVKQEVKQENLGEKFAKEEVKEENFDVGVADDAELGSPVVADIGETDVKVEVKHECGFDDEVVTRELSRVCLQRWCRGAGAGEKSGEVEAHRHDDQVCEFEKHSGVSDTGRNDTLWLVFAWYKAWL